MSKTKGEIVSAALSELGLADYEFDISTEEVASGVRRLDAMMAYWSSKGVILNYLFGESASDSDSGLPSVAEEAVITNLAVRLASSYGKQPSPFVLTTAKSALSTLYAFSTRPRERQLSSMPRGAGYKNTEQPFTDAPEDPYLDTVDNDVDLSGGLDGGT